MIEQLERAGLDLRDVEIREYGGYPTVVTAHTHPDVFAYLNTLHERTHNGVGKITHPVCSRSMLVRSLHAKIGHPDRWAVFIANPHATHHLPFDARSAKETLLCHVGISGQDIDAYLKNGSPLPVLFSPQAIVHPASMPSHWRTIYEQSHRHEEPEPVDMSPHTWFLRQQMKGNTVYTDEAVSRLQGHLSKRFGINVLYIGDGGTIQTPDHRQTHNEMLLPNFTLRTLLPHSAIVFVG